MIHKRMTKARIEGSPRTEASLREDLVKLGVERGMTLMVHSSLSSIGWVAGGPSTLVRVLLAAIGPDGTLAMPAATPPLAEPGSGGDLRQPEAPVFDPRTTPTSMGTIPEAFRNWPGTVRSRHPLESICARGPSATSITREHPLAFSEGRGGPFGKLYDLESWVLLIGVGFNRCTALHFAESLVEKRRVTKVRFPVLDGGHRVCLEVPNVADDNDTHFPIIGQKYLASGGAQQGLVGAAESILFPMRDLVELAVGYFESAL